MPNAKLQPKYDLEERTLRFAKQVVDFCKNIETDVATRPIVNQLIGAGTSIGANYAEANEAVSKNDFIHKIGIAKKEAKETRYWLEVIAHVIPEAQALATTLKAEAYELNLILATIIKKTETKSSGA